MLPVMLVIAKTDNAATFLEAAMQPGATRRCAVNHPPRATRRRTELLQQLNGVVMWEPWHFCSRDLLVELALFDIGQHACFLLRLVGLIQPIDSVVMLILALLGILLLVVVRVRHADHRKKTLFSCGALHKGRMLRRQHGNVFDYLIEE